jgi:hypothetical protein
MPKSGSKLICFLVAPPRELDGARGSSNSAVYYQTGGQFMELDKLSALNPCALALKASCLHKFDAAKRLIETVK